MEKLLHERLKDESARWYEAVELHALADEIERYYSPRPRFEDGEPVQFGDDIEIYDRSGLLDKGIIQSFHPNRGSVWMLSLVGCDHERLVRFDPETCVIKRPTPKVLDADGVEIKVGDTVYSEEGKEYVVTEHCCSNDCVVAKSSEGEGYHLMGYFLTHEKPVFDADGERIKIGDTVYFKNGRYGSIPFKVVNFGIGVGLSSVNGTVYIGRNSGTAIPENLTHREPDSLEKLRADVTAHIKEMREIGADTSWSSSIADRLTALIERSA